MKPRSVTVLGSGFAGMSAALALARDGHRVTLVARDLPVGAAVDAPTWPRHGIAHFLQPHAFKLPRAVEAVSIDTTPTAPRRGSPTTQPT